MRLTEFANDNVTTWKKIAARNNLANPNLILPGQKLDVGDDIVFPSGTTYVVKPGDTLSGIAQKIRRGWRPDADSSTTIEPTNPDSTTMGNAIASAGGQSGASEPDSTTMGNAIASAGGTKSQSPQTKKSQSDPSKYPGGIAKRSAPKQSTSTPVTTPPVINLPNVDPPQVKRGRPTMPADRDQTRPADTAKPSKQDYHDPAYDGPAAKAPVDDADIKKRIGADQPIPGYKYDAAKDKAISDKLEKQDRERQKQLQKQPGGVQGRSKPNKAPKPGTKTSSNEFDTIRDIESGNRDYDDYGRPITSHKGAKFAAQVMPTTNTDPGYGVKPAANAGAEESNRVGKDYFNAMKNKYGNSELAAAAYNAGPGRIDKILQKAKETGRHWKDLLPAETQNYIKKFTGK